MQQLYFPIDDCACRKRRPRLFPVLLFVASCLPFSGCTSAFTSLPMLGVIATSAASEPVVDTTEAKAGVTMHAQQEVPNDISRENVTLKVPLAFPPESNEQLPAIEKKSVTKREEQTTQMSLSDAIQFTLVNNESIQQYQLIPFIQRTDIDLAQSEFDSRLSANLAMSKVNQQVSSAVDAFGTGLDHLSVTNYGANQNSPDLFAVEKKWESGTITRLGYGSGYTKNNPAGSFLIYNPAYSNNVSLSLNQPLWQGKGKEFNTLGIRIARLNRGQKMHEVQIQVENILMAVEAAYWTVYRWQQELVLIEQELGGAKHLHETEKLKLELGTGNQIRLIHSIDYEQQLSVEKAKAEQSLFQAMNELARLMGISPDEQEKEFVFLTKPVITIPKANLEQSRIEARNNRPEITLAKQKLGAANLKRRQAAEALKPAINMVARYGLSGLNNSFTGSFSDATQGNYNNWSLGVQYEQPFGKRAENAVKKQADLEYQVAALEYRRNQKKIDFDVKNSFQQMKTSQKIYDTNVTRVNMLKTQLANITTMYESGQLNVEQLVNARETLLRSQRDELNAIVDLNLSISRFRKSTGQNIAWFDR